MYSDEKHVSPLQNITNYTYTSLYWGKSRKLNKSKPKLVKLLKETAH